MTTNLGRVCPYYCPIANYYSDKNCYKISQAILNTGKEFFNQYLKDREINQPEVTRLLITAKIEQILPELNADLKIDDDLFELKSDIIDETIHLLMGKIQLHSIIKS